MKHLDDLISKYSDIRTILVAGAPTEYPENMVKHLTDSSFNVIGPAETAKMALALVAQTPADLAIVSQRLSGLRDGVELARRLEETWGVPTVVLPQT